MNQNHGKFVWYDVMTTDIAAAASFYDAVIGWTSADSGMTHQTYLLFSQGPEMVAGLMEIPPHAIEKGAQPCWTGHIAVEDVDVYAAKVEAAGGSIRRTPEDIPGIGRFCVALDPHGAVFVMFKGNGVATRVPTPGATGHIGWHELHAGDLATAWPFYQSLFGWSDVGNVDMGPMGIYQMFATGDTGAVGGMMTKMPQTPAPFWLYYFNVDRVDAAVERATMAGGKLITGPHQVPGGQWIAQFTDLQGAFFAVVSMER